MSYKLHPLCAALPQMPIDEFAALKDDIQKNGLLQPITLDRQGRVLDGRHRLRACEELGITPQFVTLEELDEDGLSAAAFVLSANAYRRHLSVRERFDLIRAMNPSPDNATLARLLGVDRKTARKVKSEARRREALQIGAPDKAKDEDESCHDVSKEATEQPAEEAPNDLQVLDGLGQVVPRELWPVFDRTDVLRVLAGDVRGLIKDVHRVAQLPCGMAMPVAEIVSALQQAEALLRESLPYCLVPPQVAQRSPEIAKRGFLTVGQFKRLPKELKPGKGGQNAAQ